ncbi:hypothetical protein BOTNAR_0088g00190 [Botryotinia narcissicola]|uniref:Uncharacterized protein n=1 Tax=Botryotinia narcissicola TaxID=278944 RepID=A0A4Z1ISM2_9HELO|nr:hypothetical protein BOTNAR_0088g00190 [Botryotinia narcissicola]
MPLTTTIALSIVTSNKYYDLDSDFRQSLNSNTNSTPSNCVFFVIKPLAKIIQNHHLLPLTMDSSSPTPSWCLVCRKRLTQPYASGHGSDIPIILCLPEISPQLPYDHKREGHNGIYLHKTYAIDIFQQLNLPSSLHLGEFDLQGVGFKFPPIRDPKGLQKLVPVNGYEMPDVLEPVPQIATQTSRMALNG